MDVCWADSSRLPRPRTFKRSGIAIHGAKTPSPPSTDCHEIDGRDFGQRAYAIRGDQCVSPPVTSKGTCVVTSGSFDMCCSQRLALQIRFVPVPTPRFPRKQMKFTPQAKISLKEPFSESQPWGFPSPASNLPDGPVRGRYLSPNRGLSGVLAASSTAPTSHRNNQAPPQSHPNPS